MKLYATIKNENGKVISCGGNKALTIELTHKNKVMFGAKFTPDKIEFEDFTDNIKSK